MTDAIAKIATTTAIIVSATRRDTFPGPPSQAAS